MEIFDAALDSGAGIAWRLGRAVRALHPGKYVLDGIETPFDVEDFASASGRATLTLSEGQHHELGTGWTRKHGLQTRAKNAVYEVRWEGHALQVVVAQWRSGYERVSISLVVAETEAIARKFTHEVCAFCNEPRQAILRFTGGCWAQDRELYKSIAASSFEDLILAGDLKERIVSDFTSFISAKEEYERYGVAHKRGVLLLGPPGNGKTHCLRALVKLLALPCIYITSLKAEYTTDDANIDAVFSRARDVTPCVLVFEDLDAMINDGNRSFFLNKLDGLSNASGLITLATTNHPEKLDPAILERPSRFDRKYHFDLPSAPERERYLAMWNARVDAAMRIEPNVLAELVEDTHEFSFAYLKELWLSAMMRWIHDRKPGEMRAHVRAQTRALREQMTTARSAPRPELTTPVLPELDDD